LFVSYNPLSYILNPKPTFNTQCYND